LHVLLARVQPLLNLIHRPDSRTIRLCHQSINDGHYSILNVRLLPDLHRKLGSPLNVAFPYVMAAFDSVNRRELWKAVSSRGIPDLLLDLIVALHQGTGVQARSYTSAYQQHAL